MDTVWQHARMYGYRQMAMPYTRVYLPRRVGIRFKSIHETEEFLRDVLRQGAEGMCAPNVTASVGPENTATIRCSKATGEIVINGARHVPSNAHSDGWSHQ